MTILFPYPESGDATEPLPRNWAIQEARRREQPELALVRQRGHSTPCHAARAYLSGQWWLGYNDMTTIAAMPTEDPGFVFGKPFWVALLLDDEEVLELRVVE
eukprot:CAMPEP_0169075576 /NCGR_PEP_ID=MMETSP1015-20121227/7893_1 /TAXON_ID=342587 /ORGANISM="Karlodinium micrum, Strain CCMP2283" /LENGTH=101 /DNA_ID=CAMNT_0009134991 /DNA_START=610 /DNA_END=916 /DNA_ORIENTATION=-